MVDSNTRDLPPTRQTGDSGGEPGINDGQPSLPDGEDAPVGLRVGRNPANLGDDVSERGDVTFPETVPKPAEI